MSDALLVELAAHLPGGGGTAAERLLSAKQAWTQVRRRAEMRIAMNSADFENRLGGLNSQLKIGTWLPEKAASLADQAAAAVFLSMAIDGIQNNQPVYADALVNEAAFWRTGAALCREARHTHPDANPAWNQELSKALEVVEVYFDNHADIIKNPALPIVTRERTNDKARACTQRIAPVINSIFGSPLLGTVATLVNASLNLSGDKQVLDQDIKNWSKA
jgi:hypothetical protein